jgi:hypothetical protein
MSGACLVPPNLIEEFTKSALTRNGEQGKTKQRL